MTPRVALALLALAACVEGGATARTDVAVDALAGADTVEVVDGADATPPDTSPPDWELARAYRVTLDDGRVVEGQLVARYDRRLWWGHPAEDEVLALFDASRFADWPDDRSITFVDGARVAGREPIARAGPAYRDWLADRGIGWRVPLDGVAYVMAGAERHHLAEDGYGDFAYDLGRASPDGARWVGDGVELEDYLSWDEDVRAPIGGVVVELATDHPDRPPGGDPAELLELPENLVGLHLAGGYHAYLLHLRQGSLAPDLMGEAIAAGDALGRIGNSGTTLEPHLHMALLYWDHDRARFWSVPVDFLDVHAAPAATGSVPRARFAPLGGTWIADAPF